MKKLLFSIVALSLQLFSFCLDVGINSGQTCSGDSVSIDNITTRLTSNMKVSDKYLTLIDIPIYLFSDVEEEVQMSISQIYPLKNFKNETINTLWYYIPTGGSKYLINDNQPFVLLSNGNSTQRDGNSKIGILRIEAKSLSDLQTAGEYSLSYGLNVTLGNTISSVSTLLCKGTVAQVNKVSFRSLSFYKSGRGFVNDSIDYGRFRLYHSNEAKRDVYVKNNIDKKINIKFETADLIHELDSKYRIHVDYYYKSRNGVDQHIKSNIFFTLTEGKNSGVTPVGEMRFKTEPIKDSLIAGRYNSILYINISAN